MEYELVEQLHEDRCALAARRDGGLDEAREDVVPPSQPVMRWGRRGEHGAAQMGEG